MAHLSKTRGLTRVVTMDELELYKALLDHTREGILEELGSSPRGMTATELSKDFGLKLPTIVSHLRKLERVGAVRSYRRTGRHVNRPVAYYRAAVKVGKFKETLKNVEAAVKNFENDLSEAIFRFLQERGDVVPSFDEPVSLLEWIELLLKKTTSSIPDAILRQPSRLVNNPKFYPAAIKAAALSLVSDVTILIVNEVMNLTKTRDAKLAAIARKYGIRRVKDVGDAIFVFDVMSDLMSKNDSRRLEAQVALSELVEILPAGVRWKNELRELLPYIVRVGDVLDEKTTNRIFDFVVIDEDVGSMISRWKVNGRILQEALAQRPILASVK